MRIAPVFCYNLSDHTHFCLNTQKFLSNNDPGIRRIHTGFQAHFFQANIVKSKLYTLANAKLLDVFSVE